MNTPEFLTVPEVAARVRKSRQAIYLDIAKGVMPGTKINGSVRIPAAAFEQYLSDNTRLPTRRNTCPDAQRTERT
jgi:excisionase family DNA binding protein